MPQGLALELKHATFVQEYLVDLNGVAAAERAGMAGNAARVLSYPRVKEAVRQAMAERAARMMVTTDSVVAELAKIGFVAQEDMAANGVRTSDKVAALVALGKHLGMFIDKTQVSGPNGGALQVTVRRMIVDEAVPHD